ncbi:sensor histidine kinase [Nisaea sp.]|uniref:sensor histidine kinase n=1 Tax=Nisaea sp. TaxID=2024842 RepID=UPI003B51DE68
MKPSSPDRMERSVIHDAEGDLLVQRIEPLFSSNLPALANVAIAALVSVAARDDVPRAYLVGWVLLMGALSLYRVFLVDRFRRSRPGPSEAPFWERRMFHCAAAQGLVWSLTGLSVAQFPMPMEVIGIISVAVCGMLAGATFTLTGSQRVFRAYVFPAGIGLIAGIMLSGAPEGPVVAFMGIVYLTVVLVWGREIGRSAEERLAMAAEKAHLLANLEFAQRETELEKEFKQETYNKLGHELRTPLNSIIGFAEVIASEAVGPVGTPRYKEYAELVAESGKHLSNLIDEMLTLATGESPQTGADGEPVDVTEVMVFCRDMLAPFAKTRGIELRLSPADQDLPPIRIDPLKLRQVLINLLNNAIHYTLQGGRIELASTRGAGNFIEISVSDTGIGMSDADIPKALEPFNQLENGKTHNPHGKGIGLALSKKFVELYGGRMEIESELGVGTKITVFLPTDPRAAG